MQTFQFMQNGNRSKTRNLHYCTSSKLIHGLVVTDKLHNIEKAFTWDHTTLAQRIRQIINRWFYFIYFTQGKIQGKGTFSTCDLEPQTDFGLRNWRRTVWRKSAGQTSSCKIHFVWMLLSGHIHTNTHTRHTSCSTWITKLIINTILL